MSTVSLNSPRLPNGSGLRQEILPSPSPAVEDPLKILEEIVGQAARDGGDGDERDDASKNPERPEQLLEEVDFGGLELHKFLQDGMEERHEGLSQNIHTAQTVEECEYVCLLYVEALQLLTMGR